MELAHRAGVSVAALTDHDTTEGLDEAADAAAHLGMTLIRGVELSVDHGTLKIHLLVYFVEPGSDVLEDRLHELRVGRDERNAVIVSTLNDLGYDITLEDVHRQARGRSVGRPHIADALVERGLFASREEVFTHLLHDGGPGYVERARMTAQEAIDLAGRIGAVTVIAHPATISVPEDGYASLFRELEDIGLAGIEAHHPLHSPALRRHLTDLAASLGLAATGGSDYHGAGKRGYAIGVGTGDLRVPASAIDQLERRRPK
jgi:3',5'-nucleoside bisphosphate phosphatase